MQLTRKIFKTSKDIIAKNEFLTRKVFKIGKVWLFYDLHTFAPVTHLKIFFIHLDNSCSSPNTEINSISSVLSALTAPPQRDLNLGTSILETTLLTLIHINKQET